MNFLMVLHFFFKVKINSESVFLDKNWVVMPIKWLRNDTSVYYYELSAKIMGFRYNPIIKSFWYVNPSCLLSYRCSTNQFKIWIQLIRRQLLKSKKKLSISTIVWRILKNLDIVTCECFFSGLPHQSYYYSASSVRLAAVPIQPQIFRLQLQSCKSSDVWLNLEQLSKERNVKCLNWINIFELQLKQVDERSLCFIKKDNAKLGEIGFVAQVTKF